MARWVTPKSATSPLAPDEIIRQELVRIGDTVRDKQLGTVPSLQALAERLRTKGDIAPAWTLLRWRRHSHVDHLCGLLQWAAEQGLNDVAIHGHRWTRHAHPERSDLPEQIENAIAASGVGRS